MPRKKPDFDGGRCLIENLTERISTLGGPAGPVTPLAKLQLLQSLHPHYCAAPRAKKTQILDAVVKATAYNRKYALSLLHHGPPAAPALRPGRPVRYTGPVVDALRRLWDVSGYLCSKRLHPFLPTLLEALERCGELVLAPEIKSPLLTMRPATIDRKLAPYRRRPQPRGFTTTRPGYLLKQHIPVRTFAQWEDRRPGFVEIDLVAHCGESVHGEFVYTLGLVDVATGWFEAFAVPTRAQRGVFAALQALRARLPFPLRGIDSDNDNAFINDQLLRYCQTEHLTFTRSREYRKNDQAHIEERNGAVIRRLIGYDRYEGIAAAGVFNRAYEIQRLWTNFFQPTMKLLTKERHGTKVLKRYDQARTPYQRVLDSPAVATPHQQALRESYRSLNPIWTGQELQRRLESLWHLARRSGDL